MLALQLFSLFLSVVSQNTNKLDLIDNANGCEYDSPLQTINNKHRAPQISTKSTMTEAPKNDDWRVSLLGENIQLNQQPKDEESADKEQSPEFVPIEKALDQSLYDYVAIFIGADYCPHCKAFAPTVKAAVTTLEEHRKCKVLFLSNDRTGEAFKASCVKNTGIDVVPYNLEKTGAIRDLFELKTIPALLILKNDAKPTPTIITNARNTLVADPEAKFFPWVNDKPMSFMDRLIIRGKYGKWWELGHHINPDFRKCPFLAFCSTTLLLRTMANTSILNMLHVLCLSFLYITCLQRIKSTWMNMLSALALVYSTL